MVKARRRIVYRKKAQNRFSLLLAGTVAAIVLGLIVPRGWKLRTQLQDYTAQKAELEAQISEEEKRAEELDEYAKYTKTDEYVEKVAREKLGLVKKGEILFRSSGSAGTGGSSSNSAAQESVSQGESATQGDLSLTEDAGQENTALGESTGQTQAETTGTATESVLPDSEETAAQTQVTAQEADEQSAASGTNEQSTDSTASVWEQTGAGEQTAGTQG